MRLKTPVYRWTALLALLVCRDQPASLRLGGATASPFETETLSLRSWRGGKGTIVGRHGGFADKVRADASAVIPLPEGMDIASAGPLFCGGITVFNPLKQFDVKPTDKVAVIGMAGLVT